MSLKTRLVEGLNSGLKRVDLSLVRPSRLRDIVAQDAGSLPISHTGQELPSGALAYLRWDNPRLLELEGRYRRFDQPVTKHSQWTDSYIRQELDLAHFRGDNAYLWQLRDGNQEVNHLLVAYYACRVGRAELLSTLLEDGLFGVRTYMFEDRIQISRDLLDSVLEIDFLDRHLGIMNRPGFTMLDVGAGYGRLAHRLLHAIPTLGAVLCTDGVAVSTFLCEYHLRFRFPQGSRAMTVPVDELNDALSAHPPDLAVNIHSFSECSVQAIEWWLDLLRRHSVRNLLIVPNAEGHGGEQLLAKEADQTRTDIVPLLRERGYHRTVSEPKYRDSAVQRLGVTPTWYHLFSLE